MKFTVITSTYNAARDLPVTARSLADQVCRDFEWIIIDGASSDDTAGVVRSLGKLVATFVSERDTGIYNAWNKALTHVRGEWVIFLGAGDALYDDEVLERARQLLDDLPRNVTLAYGRVQVVDGPGGNPVRLRDETWDGFGKWWSLRKPQIPSHQAVFQRSSLFRDGFRFDETLRICADSELMLRELVADRGRKIDLTVARFALGGTSQAARNRLKKTSEFARIYRKLGLQNTRPFYEIAAFVNSFRVHLVERLSSVLRR